MVQASVFLQATGGGVPRKRTLPRAHAINYSGRTSEVGFSLNLRGLVYLASTRSRVPNNLFGSDLELQGVVFVLLTIL